MAHVKGFCTPWVKCAAVLSATVAIALNVQFVHATEKRSRVLTLESNERPVTEIAVNGVRTLAVIETGATLPVIDDDFIASADINWRPTEQLEILGLGGTRTYPTSDLSSLAIGELQWTDVPVAVNTVNRDPVKQSILPISLFDERVVDFDFANQTLTLYEGAPKRVRRSRTSTLNYTYSDRLIFIDVEINGEIGTALIDTGAHVSFVNPAFVKAARGKLDIEGTQRVRGSDLSNHYVSVYQFRRFQVGDYTAQKARFLVLKSQLFDMLGLADTPAMILGMDVLRHWRMQVDRERQQITFVLPKTKRRGLTISSSDNRMTAQRRN